MKKLFMILLLIPSFGFCDQEKEVKILISNVYEKILKEAEKSWPNDYEMQVYVANQQMKAYLELLKIKAEILKSKSNQ